MSFYMYAHEVLMISVLNGQLISSSCINDDRKLCFYYNEIIVYDDILAAYIVVKTTILL